MTAAVSVLTLQHTDWGSCSAVKGLGHVSSFFYHKSYIYVTADCFHEACGGVLDALGLWKCDFHTVVN